MLTVFGIRSCDTCRKARKYFAENDIEFTFHDVRDDGLDIQMLERWASRIDWTKLLNKQSLTWRKIPEVDRNDMSESKEFALMIENPTLVKRPVLENANDGGVPIAVGFSEARFGEFLKRHVYRIDTLADTSGDVIFGELVLRIGEHLVGVVDFDEVA